MPPSYIDRGQALLLTLQARPSDDFSRVWGDRRWYHGSLRTRSTHSLIQNGVRTPSPLLDHHSDLIEIWQERDNKLRDEVLKEMEQGKHGGMPPKAP